MYVVQNLTGRKIVFQGMTILPYGNIMVASVTDSMNLSKLMNAGKISCTLMKKETANVPTFADKRKQEKVEVKVEKPQVKEKTFAEKKAEKEVVAKAPVVQEEVKQEPEKVEEPVVEEKKEEEVDNKKKPTKKYGKKWDN